MLVTPRRPRFGVLQVPKGRARFQLVRDLKAPM